MRISDWSSDVCSSYLEQVTFFDQFQAALAARESKQVELTVLRASDTTRLSAMTDAEGKLGFQVIPQGLEPKTIHYGFMEALPKSVSRSFETLALQVRSFGKLFKGELDPQKTLRSEEHTSELQSLMRISYAVFCLKKKKTT